MESDIVERLRYKAEIDDYNPAKRPSESRILREAADEIERLRAELAAMRQQRDEARELYCRQIAYDLFRTTGVFDPQQVAIKRVWAGLFKANEPAPREKEGGGA